MTSQRPPLVRRLVRALAALLALAALVYAFVRLLRRGAAVEPAASTAWPTLDDGAPNGTAPDETAPDETAPEPASQEPESAWTEPTDGVCPTSHPVKGKASSGIFHVPGGLNYERTKADRCYRTPDDAAADGLRPSKR